MGSIRNPKQYCFAIIAAMGSIRNPKQYCFAISSITTHKVLTSGMHEASHWKCQCRILTARTSGHGKKMCRPWSQLAGNMTGHLALIRGNESHIGDYNLVFLVLFFVVWIVVTVSVTRQSQKYTYIYIYPSANSLRSMEWGWWNETFLQTSPMDDKNWNCPNMATLLANLANRNQKLLRLR